MSRFTTTDMHMRLHPSDQDMRLCLTACVLEMHSSSHDVHLRPELVIRLS